MLLVYVIERNLKKKKKKERRQWAEGCRAREARNLACKSLDKPGANQVIPMAHVTRKC